MLRENSTRQVAQIIAEAKSIVKRLDSQAQATYNECRMTSAELGLQSAARTSVRCSTLEIRQRRNHTMQRRAFASRSVIIPTLVLQLVPLVLFPPESFAPTTQEWWLPVLLTVMVL